MRPHNTKAQVLDTLTTLGPSTVQEIVEHTGLPMHVVASCLTGLKSTGIVESKRKRHCKITGFWRMMYGFKTFDAFETAKASCRKQPDIKQVIDALERAERSLTAQADALAKDLDYNAEFFAADAEFMREAIGILRCLTGIDATPINVEPE